MLRELEVFSYSATREPAISASPLMYFWRCTCKYYVSLANINNVAFSMPAEPCTMLPFPLPPLIVLQMREKTAPATCPQGCNGYINFQLGLKDIKTSVRMNTGASQKPTQSLNSWAFGQIPLTSLPVIVHIHKKSLPRTSQWKKIKSQFFMQTVTPSVPFFPLAVDLQVRQIH